MRLRLGAAVSSLLRRALRDRLVPAWARRDTRKSIGERGEGSAPEKFTHGTVRARRLLLGASVVGLLVATVQLAGEPVSVFGIGVNVSDDVLRGMLVLVVVYLAASFMVCVFTDLAAARPSRFEIRLREKIIGQTDDIRQQTVERLGSLLPSGPGETFHSQSFESLLNDAAPKTPAYGTAMIDNTIRDILQWLSREPGRKDTGESLSEDRVANRYKPALEELLAGHEVKCRRRRLVNTPRWALHRASILLRFVFFDALGPALIAILAIALLVGWIDSAWLVDSVRKLAG